MDKMFMVDTKKVDTLVDILKKMFTNVMTEKLDGGVHIEVTMENGFAASIIQTPFSKGGYAGLFELAVVKNGELCYDTPITNDVLGCMTLRETVKATIEVSELPSD